MSRANSFLPIAFRFTNRHTNSSISIQRTMRLTLGRHVNTRFTIRFRRHRITSSPNRISDYLSTKIATASRHSALTFGRQAVTIQTRACTFNFMLLLTQRARFTPTNTDNGSRYLNFRTNAAFRASFIRITNVLHQSRYDNTLRIRSIRVMLLSIFFRDTNRLQPFNFLRQSRILSNRNIRRLPAGAFDNSTNTGTFADDMGNHQYTNQTATSSRCVRNFFNTSFLDLTLNATNISLNRGFFRTRTTLTRSFTIRMGT